MTIVRATGLTVLVCASTALFVLGFMVLRGPPGTWLPDVVLDHDRPRPQGGWYRCAVGEPTTLNPFCGSQSVLRMALGYTHDGLLDHDPRSGELRAALATRLPRVTVTADGRSAFEFELRDGLRFSDGEPVTLDDVEFTVRAATGPDLPLGEIAGALQSVAGFERIGPRGFRIELGSYHFSGVSDVGVHLRVVQKRWFESQIAAVARARGLATPKIGSREFSSCLADVETPGPGTGPYRMAEQDAGWRRGRALNLVQNPLSWRRDAYPECWNLAGIQLVFDPSLAVRLTAALAETVDYFITADDCDALLAAHPALGEHYRVYEYDKLNAQVLQVVWSCAVEPFDRPEVRRALSMLFDRETILEQLYGNHGHVATSWFPPGSEHIRDDARAIPFDVRRARAELERAGCAGLEVPILCAAGSAVWRRTLELAQSAFDDAGIKLRIVSEPWEVVQQRLTDGDFTGGVIRYYQHAAIPDPATMFHSSSSKPHGGFANRDLDRLLAAAPTEPHAGKRVARFREVDAALAEAEPVTQLVYPSVRLFLHRRFQGVELGRLGLVPDTWWVEDTLAR